MSNFDFSVIENNQSTRKPHPFTEGQEESTQELFDFSAVQQPNMSHTLTNALKTDPDRAANVSRIAKQQGLPVDTVENLYDQIATEDKAKAAEMQLSLSGAKHTLAFMSDSQNAKIAHDDIATLSGIEERTSALDELARGIRRSGEMFIQTAAEGAGFIAGGLDLGAQAIEDFTGLPSGGAYKSLQNTMFKVADYQDSRLNSGHLAIPDYLQSPLVSKDWEMNWDLLEKPEYITVQITQAVNSMLPSLAVFYAAAPAAGVAGMAKAGAAIGGIQEAGASYKELVQDGVNQKDAFLAATAIGGFTMFLEKVGLDRIAQKIPTKSLMQSLTSRAASGFTEGASEYMEEPVQAFFEGLAKGKSEEEIYADVIDSLRNVEVGLGAFFVGSSISRTAKQTQKEIGNAAAAEKNSMLLNEISDLVTESNTGQRSPETLHAFLSSLPESTRTQYVSAEKFVELLQAPQQGKEIGSFSDIADRLEIPPQTLQDAFTSGATVPVSVPTFMTSLSPDERALLIPHMSYEIGAMTQAEAAGFNISETADKILQAYTTHWGNAERSALPDLTPENLTDLSETSDFKSFANTAGQIIGLDESFDVESYFSEGTQPEQDAQYYKLRHLLVAASEEMKHNGTPINEEAKEVINRIKTTDEQITQTRYDNNMTGVDRSRLADLDATEQDMLMFENLMNEVDKEASAKLDRALLRERNTQRKQAEAEATQSVDNEPLYQAITTLTGGSGLDEQYMLDYHGETTTALIKKKHRGLIKKNGEHGDIAALSHGFFDANEFVDALLDAPSRKDRIATVTDSFLSFDDSKHSTLEAVLGNDSYGRFLETYNDLFSKKLKQETFTPREHLRNEAQDKIAFLTAGEAIQYAAHVQTMRIQSRLREEAERAGDYDKAARHLRKERAAHEFIAEAIRTRKEIESIISKAKSLAKANGIENQHRDQIRKLMQRFNFSGSSEAFKPRNPEHMQPLRDVVESDSELMDTATDFPTWLTEDNAGTDWRMLSVADLRQVDNLINFLGHKGKQLKSDAEDSYRQKIDQKRAACIAPMLGRERKIHDKGSTKRKLADSTAAIHARLDTLRFLADRADGFSNIGKNGERGANLTIINDAVITCQNNQDLYNTEINQRVFPALQTLERLTRRLEKAYGKDGFTTVEIDGQRVELKLPDIMRKDGRKWTPDAIVGALLHTGSKSNLKRLEAGYGGKGSVPYQQFRKLLTKEELDAIQTFWDTAEYLYPDADRVHQNINGFHMNKVKAQSFAVKVDGKTATYKGGYMPAVYDKSYEETAPIRNDKSAADSIKGAPEIKGTTKPKDSFTKQRTGEKYPLLLSANVAIQYFYDTAHYITHAETMQEIDQITKHEDYKNAWISDFGKESYESLRGILQNIGRPQRSIEKIEDNFASKLREHATPYILALNFKVATKQVFSIFGGVHDIGAADFISGVKASLKTSPRKNMKWIHAVSPYMQSRATTAHEELARMGRQLGINDTLISAFGKDISKQDIVDLGFWPIRAADMATTYTVWVAGYNKAMKQGKTMEEAVTYADNIVRTSQPSFQAADKMMFQIEGNAWKRVFSMFIGFTVGAFGNRVRHHTRAKIEGALTNTQYAKYVLYDCVLPPVMMKLAFAAAGDDLPEWDEDSMTEFLLDMCSDIAGYMPVGYPIISDIFSTFTPFVSPAGVGLEALQDVIQNTVKLIEDDDKNTQEKLLISLANAASYKAKVPLSKMVQRMQKGLQQYEDDEGTVLNILIPEHKKH